MRKRCDLDMRGIKDAKMNVMSVEGLIGGRVDWVWIRLFLFLLFLMTY